MAFSNREWLNRAVTFSTFSNMAVPSSNRVVPFSNRAVPFSNRVVPFFNRVVPFFFGSALDNRGWVYCTHAVQSDFSIGGA